uniref:Sodium/nucleoside cotransporter n=1 Tax=Anopheles epiroticus TaxID=199890 RepID=A0A182P5K3_9DIPT
MSGVQNDAFLTEIEGVPSISYEHDGQTIPASGRRKQSPTEKLYDRLSGAIERHRKHIQLGVYIVLNVVVIVFFGFATNYYLEHEVTLKCLKPFVLTLAVFVSFTEQNECGMQWCDGYGMLVLLVGLVYLGLVYYHLVKPLFGRYFKESIVQPVTRIVVNFTKPWYIRLAAVGLVLAGFALFVYFETRDQTERLISLAGMAFLLVISFLLSKHPTRINFRTVVLGAVFQFLLGLFCIRWEVGRSIFSCIGDKVATFLNYTRAGASFVYGMVLVGDGENEYAIFAFSVLSVIYFFSFFISILYYLGAMQWVVLKLGWILQSILGTTVCESVIAAANMFLGMSESPLLIRPYLKDLTYSEIHSIMTSGYATVSGTVLAAYISFGANPAHLITASVMAAPGALCFAKMIYPETEESKTRSDNIQMEESTDSSMLDAASNGASAATPLVLGIIANLIAFVSFIAFVNGVLSWLGWRVGWEDVSLENIFGAIFRPLAFVMGVPWDDSYYVGKVIGIKMIVNEFVAFQRLGDFITDQVISPRSAAIATYAVCGFANPSSMGIMIGTLSAMTPDKRGVITSVAFRAFMAGSIVCFMTASIGGLLMDEAIFNNFGKMASIDQSVILNGTEEIALSTLGLDDSQAPSSGVQNRYGNLKRYTSICTINGCVAVFFAFATKHFIQNEQSCETNCGMQWCNGYGMLLLLLGFVYVGMLYFLLLKPRLGQTVHSSMLAPIGSYFGKMFRSRIAKLSLGALVVLAFALFLFFDTRDDTIRLMPLTGMVVLLALSFLASKNRSAISYRPVCAGLLVQALLGLVCIRWDVGRSIFACIGAKVDTFLSYSSVGATFVYGDALINRYAVFAFGVLSVIYFFSFFISVLYYLGAMQWVVLKLGRILQALMGTTVCEGIMAAANIFLGMSETPLIIRPYVKDLTHSELHSVMASGFATVSGTVLAAYISFGASPGHLVTASVISAPAVLCVAKIIYPEVEESKTTSENIQIEKSSDSSVVDAACNGASSATSLILGIIANLIAFVSFVAFVNGVLAWLGMLVGVDGVSLEWFFGYIFRPLAFVMGVSWEDSKHVGQVIGVKTVVNEFVAYQRLGEIMRNELITKRSATIATYAICGFANPSSLGIMIGAMSAMAPERRSSITSVSLRAFITGSVACFMTACIAGKRTQG